MCRTCLCLVRVQGTDLKTGHLWNLFYFVNKTFLNVQKRTEEGRCSRKVTTTKETARIPRDVGRDLRAKSVVKVGHRRWDLDLLLPGVVTQRCSGARTAGQEGCAKLEM